MCTVTCIIGMFVYKLHITYEKLFMQTKALPNSTQVFPPYTAENSERVSPLLASLSLSPLRSGTEAVEENERKRKFLEILKII